MMSVRLYLGIGGLVCLMLPDQSSIAQEAAPAAEAPAEKKAPPSGEEFNAGVAQKAREWLALVDAGKYAESYDKSCPFLRQHYEREHWIRAMTVALKPLGAVKSRTVRVVEDHRGTALPGGPVRQYMIVRFDTVYEHLPSADESVTLMYLHDQGGWLAVGYFVK